MLQRKVQLEGNHCGSKGNNYQKKQKEIAYNLRDFFSSSKENSYDGKHDLDNESPFYSIDFNFYNQN